MSELKLDPQRTAIVVIDLQKGIATIPGGAPHSKPAVIANSARCSPRPGAAGAQPILVHVPVCLGWADRLQSISDQPMRATQETAA